MLAQVLSIGPAAELTDELPDPTGDLMRGRILPRRRPLAAVATVAVLPSASADH